MPPPRRRTTSRIVTHQEEIFMQTAQGTMLESLRSVETFLDAHADKLAGVVKTGARQKLTDAIAALDAHASDQSGGLGAIGQRTSSRGRRSGATSA
jgi:hypothetical protein